MIVSLGVDAVEIERFDAWKAYSYKQLVRIFTESELNYCFAIPTKISERLALRFAAKEAFFKALSPIIPDCRVSFLRMARHISVEKYDCGSIYLAVHWPALQALGLACDLEGLTIHLSASHTKVTAFACVIMERSGKKSLKLNPDA